MTQSVQIGDTKGWARISRKCNITYQYTNNIASVCLSNGNVVGSMSNEQQHTEHITHLTNDNIPK